MEIAELQWKARHVDNVEAVRKSLSTPRSDGGALAESRHQCIDAIVYSATASGSDGADILETCANLLLLDPSQAENVDRALEAAARACADRVRAAQDGG